MFLRKMVPAIKPKPIQARSFFLSQMFNTKRFTKHIAQGSKVTKIIVRTNPEDRCILEAFANKLDSYHIACTDVLPVGKNQLAVEAWYLNSATIEKTVEKIWRETLQMHKANDELKNQPNNP